MHPVLFHVRSVTVYSYGFFVALAVLAGYLLSQRQAKRFGFSKTAVADLFFLLFVSGVAGARVFYVLQHFEDYQHQLWKIFLIQEGGLVWYGGFIIAALVGFGYAFLRKWPLLKLCDFFSPVLALAHGIGRLGCFFNGCCFGRIAKTPFEIMIPGEEPFHRIPIQLYESGFLLVLSFYLLDRLGKAHREGEIFVRYLVFYSAARFVLEFFRGDQILVAFLTPPQWTSVLLFAGAIFFLFILKKKPR